MADRARQNIFSFAFSCIIEKKAVTLQRETNIVFNYPYLSAIVCVSAAGSTAGESVFADG